MNKIYQWLWYNVFKKLLPTNSGYGPFRSNTRMKFQIGLAKLMGGFVGVILGDSEMAMMDNYETMKNFKGGIVINMGEGGTTPLDWHSYFVGEGKSIYNEIKSKGIIWSIGGNCAVKNMMTQIPEILKAIHEMFVGSWIILIPPVLASWFGSNTASFKINIDVVRNYQRTIWSGNVIDTHTPFLDKKTGEAIPGTLRDPLHFSTFAVSLVQKVFDVII